MVMEVKPQAEKQRSPKLVTDSGIRVFSQPAISVFVDVSMIALQFSLESYTGLPSATIMLSKRQPLKHANPRLVTDSGMVMEGKLQPQKQPSPILVTEFGMEMEVKS